MGATDHEVERDREERNEGEEQGREGGGMGERDVEKGEAVNGGGGDGDGDGDGGEHGREFHMSMMQRLNPTNPLRIHVISQVPSRAATPSPAQPPLQPRSTPTPQQSLITLNSRKYTNKMSLCLFCLHFLLAIGLVGFLVFKGVQGLIQASDRVKRKEMRVLKFFLPQVEAASLLSITLAFAWQKAFRVWPNFMVHFIMWCSFLTSLSAGILLICFQKASTDGVGVCLMGFAIGNGLYACWVTQRIGFCTKVLVKSLEPVSKFPDLNQPTYWMLGVGFLWMSLWIIAVLGALNFYFPPLTIIALVLSLAWTAEVQRNVVNLTVSRVISLYYLRGMQSSTKFCFQRALTKNLGSACLGSLFVPAIEALRIVARGLNLLEGEDEFMFSCAHCCLNVMQFIFSCGNGWAFVQIAAYGKGFVKASKDTWSLFKSQEMEEIVDSDITSSICFLTGVCSGSICVIMVAAWTFKVHQPFTATISLLAFFIGYLMVHFIYLHTNIITWSSCCPLFLVLSWWGNLLLISCLIGILLGAFFILLQTRIAMALPHACVSCYYVCYAENPDNRLFDKTIKDRQSLIKSGRDVVVPTPRVPRRFTT